MKIFYDFFLMLKSEYFFTEFLCKEKEVLVTFHPVTILRYSPDLVD